MRAVWETVADFAEARRGLFALPFISGPSLTNVRACWLRSADNSHFLLAARMHCPCHCLFMRSLVNARLEQEPMSGLYMLTAVLHPSNTQLDLQTLTPARLLSWQSNPPVCCSDCTASAGRGAGPGQQPGQAVWPSADIPKP